MLNRANVKPLRPAAMQSNPVRLAGVFDDPDAVVDLIATRAPYMTLAEYHHMQDTMKGDRAQPWFRVHFDDDLFLQNPRWMQSAKEAFSAEIVRPLRCILNLNGPMPGGAVHLDLPSYRGLAPSNAPVWLLMNMGASRLFMPWMVPMAKGLTWLYRGIGGEFQYWADGIDKPPHVETALWNTGVMSDNEFLWHGVGPIGTDEEQKRLKGALSPSDRLHHVENDEWEIRNGDRVVSSLSSSQLRISLVWKAHVFLNEDHFASFKNHDMDLTLGDVTDIYLEDLASKGIHVRRPDDPLGEPGWRETLEKNYPQPFSRQANNEYN